MANSVNFLPKEMHANWMSHLDFPRYLAVSVTCRFFHNLCQDKKVLEVDKSRIIFNAFIRNAPQELHEPILIKF